ncbi:hypothetical protein B0J18DRAFT_466847 [Chaetomium sp. MPI-SDFR-AT-0129]|uniref:Uncharacterized protein n=1 Tax=Dichotomopilus funicola TaxID=1934379 RepID=A0AAN6ZNG1_9PEZI|nr:hypothetical protein B0J18DRAFT_466847 [Chaetomium sp. MPI-SDFR-AT-0129]KAK4144114.1 hypothetical protein C8A04DRAFT_28233 [Dichotomopilus funicola]
MASNGSSGGNKGAGTSGGESGIVVIGDGPTGGPGRDGGRGSAGGGFDRFKCKYWLTHNCPGTTYCNGHPCHMCMVSGRFSFDTEAPRSPSQSPRQRTATAWQDPEHRGYPVPARPTEVYVPHAVNGTLQYTLWKYPPAPGLAGAR